MKPRGVTSVDRGGQASGLSLSNSHTLHLWNFLWGYVKDQVYATKITEVEDLKTWVSDAITTINRGMLDRTWESFTLSIRQISRHSANYDSSCSSLNISLIFLTMSSLKLFHRLFSLPRCRFPFGSAPLLYPLSHLQLPHKP